MTFRIVLTLLAFFTAFQTCHPVENNKPLSPNKPKATNSEFKPYVSSFEDYSKLDAQKVPITLAKLDEHIAGICHYFRIGNGPIRWARIEIDEEYWGKISDYQKTNLIFHELGHCVMGLDHIPWTNYATQCPDSFMYKSVLTTQCIKDNYDAYIKEMFPQWEK